MEKRACVASTIVGNDVVIFTASVLASRWPKISPVIAEMIVSEGRGSTAVACTRGLCDGSSWPWGGLALVVRNFCPSVRPSVFLWHLLLCRQITALDLPRQWRNEGSSRGRMVSEARTLHVCTYTTLVLLHVLVGVGKAARRRGFLLTSTPPSYGASITLQDHNHAYSPNAPSPPSPFPPSLLLPLLLPSCSSRLLARTMTSTLALTSTSDIRYPTSDIRQESYRADVPQKTPDPSSFAFNRR